MAAPGWYNENAFRTYPLVEATGAAPMLTLSGGPLPLNRLLPARVLVDAGFSFDAPEFTDPAAALVYLYQISRVGSVIAIDFRTTVAGFAGQSLTFRRHVDDLEWTSSQETRVVTDDDGIELRWSGYLATGPLDQLLEFLTEGAVAAAGTSFRIEPSLVRTLAKSYVRGVTLLNHSRIHAGEPGETATSFEPGVLVQASSLVGDLLIAEGYNLSIRQDTAEATLTFAAAVGAGLGEPCEELPRSPGEIKPTSSIFYTGGPSCAETISAINGQHGRAIKLVGKNGVTVTADPTMTNRLFVSFGLMSAANCLPKAVVKIYVETNAPELWKGPLP